MQTESFLGDDVCSQASTLGHDNLSCSGASLIPTEIIIPGATSLTYGVKSHLAPTSMEVPTAFSMEKTIFSAPARSIPQQDPWKGLARGTSPQVEVEGSLQSNQRQQQEHGLTAEEKPVDDLTTPMKLGSEIP